MQLDEAVAHRAVDGKIAHELHAAMLTEKKRAPEGARLLPCLCVLEAVNHADEEMLTSVPAGGVIETPFCALDRPLQVKEAAGSFSIVA